MLGYVGVCWDKLVKLGSFKGSWEQLETDEVKC